MEFQSLVEVADPLLADILIRETKVKGLIIFGDKPEEILFLLFIGTDLFDVVDLDNFFRVSKFL